MQYDIIHFEALGMESQYLEQEIQHSITAGKLPADHSYLVTADTVQDYLRKSSNNSLPEIISLKGHSKIPDWYLEGKKKNIICRAAGYDPVEHLGLTVNLTSLREYCVNAVAQTAIRFLYATTGNLNCYTAATPIFDRKTVPSFLELGPHRTATVFGVGRIGKRIYELLEANGLTAQAVDIREKELSKQYGGSVRFVSAKEAMATSDIIISGMNLTKDPSHPFYNVGYFSEELFSHATKPLIFINVTRGDIAPEAILLNLYQQGKLTGIGIDAFSEEGEFSDFIKGKTETSNKDHLAGKTLVEMSLSRNENIYVQPHQGFNSDIAAGQKAAESIKHLIYWYAHGKKGFFEQIPYY
jgi:D-lactate dehydrogenase